MKKLEASDLKDLNLLKHYRIIRKWACKNNGLTDAEFELIIYLDCIDLFTKKDFETGVYTYNRFIRRHTMKQVQLQCTIVSVCPLVGDRIRYRIVYGSPSGASNEQHSHDDRD